MTASLRWLLALAAGAVWGLCFGRTVWVLAPGLALVPLLLLLGQKRAWWLGWLHGLAFWMVSIPWIVPTLRNYGQLPVWLATSSLFLLAAYLALFTGLFAGIAGLFWRRSAIGVALIAIPATWVVVEWLRGVLFTGFPWNLTAYSWIDVPGALPLAAWVGPWGVGYLILLSNTGIALAVSQRRWRTAACAIGGILVVLAVAARWAVPVDDRVDRMDRLPVRVLQPDIGVLNTWDAAAIEEQYQRMLALSRSACDEPGALLVWPESAAWPYSYSEHERLVRDLGQLAAMGCPLLINTSMESEVGSYNSVLLLDDEGVVGRYDKRHLVPFGEYVPLAGLFPYLKKIARLAGDFLTGDDVGLLEWRGERLSPAICFEITFPGAVAEQVRAGGTILVTVTNDAWYGDSWAPWQHVRAARFRAAENRRFLLRAAITGISAIVRPDGSIVDSLGVGEEGVLPASIYGASELSPFSRAPWVVPSFCLLLLGFAILRSRRRRNL